MYQGETWSKRDDEVTLHKEQSFFSRTKKIYLARSERLKLYSSFKETYYFLQPRDFELASSSLEALLQPRAIQKGFICFSTFDNNLTGSNNSTIIRDNLLGQRKEVGVKLIPVSLAQGAITHKKPY